MPQFVCNGTLLKKEVAQKLQEENVLFGVSIDGKKKEHDMNRVTRDGKGTFDSIIKNIKGIKHRDYVGAALTVSNDNLHFLEGFKFLSKYFNTVSVKIIRPEINEHLKVSEIKEEYHQLVNYLLDEMNKGKPESLLRLLNGDDFFSRFLTRVLLDQGVFHRCDAGVGKFALDSDHKAYVCSGSVGILELQIGSLGDIDFDKGRKLQLQSKEESICNGCPFVKICGGECLVNYSYHQVDEEMCEIKKYLIKMSLYLKAILMFHYPSMYQYLKDFCMEKNSRTYQEPVFKNLLKSLDGKMSFMELKEIKDNDNKQYQRMVSQFNLEE